MGDNGGKAWLVEGPVVESASLTDAAWSLLPEHKFDRLGEAVAGLGDANGDGLADLAVSAPRQTSYGVFYPGRVYVFSAPFEGTQTGAEADLVLQGEGIADFAGATLLGGRDLDGDCLPDLLVAAPERDDDGKDAGAVYLLTGLSW